MFTSANVLIAETTGPRYGASIEAKRIPYDHGVVECYTHIFEFLAYIVHLVDVLRDFLLQFFVLLRHLYLSASRLVIFEIFEAVQVLR